MQAGLDVNVDSSAVVVVESSSSAHMSYADVENNNGDVMAVYSSTLSVDHTTFKSNAGGGVIVAIDGAALDVSHSAFTDNSVDPITRSRAPISLWDGSVATLAASSFAGNAVDGATASTTAGAVFAAGVGTAAVLEAVAFTSNQATGTQMAAGAVLVHGSAMLSGRRCTFSLNQASAPTGGGGVCADSAEIVLRNASFANNHAASHSALPSLSGAGAIYCERTAVNVSDTAIVNNTVASDGQQFTEGLYAFAPTSIKLLDTSFQPLLDGSGTVSINPGSVDGVTAGGCEQHPCAKGFACSLDRFSLHCDACPPDTFSKHGRACEYCPAGQGATDDQTGCQACGPNEASTHGICQPCSETQIAKDGGQRCEECPAAQTAHAHEAGGERVCVCKDGSYNASRAVITCYASGESFDKEPRAAVTEQCLSCAGMDCVRCVGGEAQLLPGYSVSQTAKGGARVANWSLASFEDRVDIFECALAAGCAGQDNVTGLAACSPGYTGALCSVCANDFVKTGGSCMDCTGTETSGGTIVALVLTVGSAVGLVVFCTASRDSTDVDTAVDTATEWIVQGKIVIGLMQIVVELPEVLTIVYPKLFSDLLEALRFLMDPLFQLLEALRIDCISPLNLHVRFSAIMLLPPVGLVIVQLLRKLADLRAGCSVSGDALEARKQANRTSAAYRSFFLFFLL